MLEKNEGGGKNFDKIKVFYSEDEKLKMLGELLSNKSSRDIIKLLIENEMYTNEIADKLGLRPNLVIHHLKKLEDLGLLQIQNKKITKKGIEHKHYRINQYFFLAPSGMEEEIQKEGSLKKIFRKGIRFVAIGLCAYASWFLSQPALLPSWDDFRENSGSVTLDRIQPSFTDTLLEFEPLTVVLLVIITGITLERILSYLVNKRKKKGD